VCSTVFKGVFKSAPYLGYFLEVQLAIAAAAAAAAAEAKAIAVVVAAAAVAADEDSPPLYKEVMHQPLPTIL
jgi:hypothetical protein